MRTVYFLVVLVAMLGGGGWARSENPAVGGDASSVSAKDLVDLIVEDLQKIGRVEVDQIDTGSKDGIIDTRELSRIVDSADIGPEAVEAVVRVALSKFSDFEAYPRRGFGVLNPGHFFVQYGDRRSQTFIDVISSSETGGVRVRILVRHVKCKVGSFGA